MSFRVGSSSLSSDPTHAGVTIKALPRRRSGFGSEFLQIDLVYLNGKRIGTIQTKTVAGRTEVNTFSEGLGTKENSGAAVHGRDIDWLIREATRGTHFKQGDVVMVSRGMQSPIFFMERTIDTGDVGTVVSSDHNGVMVRFEGMKEPVRLHDEELMKAKYS